MTREPRPYPLPLPTAHDPVELRFLACQLPCYVLESWGLKPSPEDSTSPNSSFLTPSGPELENAPRGRQCSQRERVLGVHSCVGISMNGDRYSNICKASCIRVEGFAST